MMYGMRTTIQLDPDVAAAVERMRREQKIGLSQAVNHLARAALTAKPATGTFRQRTANLGLRIDVTNIAEALEQLEDGSHR